VEMMDENKIYIKRESKNTTASATTFYINMMVQQEFNINFASSY